MKNTLQFLTNPTLICILLLQFLTTIGSAQSSLHSDERFVKWAALFREHQYQQVLTIIESDMQSAKPHPLAGYAWIKTHAAIGDLKTALQQTDSRFKAEMTASAEIFTRYENDETLQLFDKYKKQEETKILNVYSISTLGSAFMQIDVALAYDIMAKAIEKEPSSFRPLWVIAFNLTNGKFRSLLEKDLSAGRFNRFPVVQKYLTTVTRFRPLENYQRIAAAKEYLKDIPDEAAALRFLASDLEYVERYQEASEYYLQSFQLDPFYGYNLSDAVEMNLRQNKRLQAEKHALQAGSYHPVQSLENQSILIEALLNSGNIDGARAEVVKALNDFPKSGKLWKLYGQVEKVCQRYEIAQKYLEKSIALEPSVFHTYELLINTCVLAGEYTKGIEWFEMWREKGIINEDICYQALECYLKQEEFAGAEELARLLKIQYPESYWIKIERARALTKLKEYNPAYELFQEIFAEKEPSAWNIGLYSNLLALKHDANAQLAQLEALCAIYPWSEDLWKSIADFKQGNREKLQVWQRAAQLNPDRLFPYEQMRYIMNREDRFDEFRRLIQSKLASIQANGSAEDRINLNFELGIAIVNKAGKQPVDSAEIEQSRTYLNKYMELGGRESAGHQYLSSLCEATGDMPSAARHLEQAVFRRPDYFSNIFDLNTKFNEDYPSGRASRLLNAYVNRNTYDGDRLKSAIHLCAYWKGSTVNALRYIALCKEHAPGIDLSSYEAKVYGDLGDSYKHFNSSYQRSQSIARSFRYIDWYNNARRKAREKSARVDYDFLANTAMITFPDGTIATRKENIEFGKLERFEMGNAFLECSYDTLANITLIRNSAGATIELGYDSSGLITKLITKDTNIVELQIEYNGIRKPSKITLSGAGSLQMTYEENGSVSDVKSIPIDSTIEEFEVSFQISTVFDRLMKLVKAVESLNNINPAIIPKLGGVDTMYVMLEQEYDEAEEVLEETPNDLGTANKYYESAWLLSDYIRKNIHFSPYYGEKGLGITSQVLNNLMDKEQVLKNRGELAVRFVGLYYDLLYITRLRNVDESYWSHWSIVQDWLEGIAATETNEQTRRAIVQILVRIKEEPIELLENSYWLPHSILQNSGYWKKYSLDYLLPQKLREGASVNAMLYRENGHLVVGTSKGLCVQHHGYWEWFAFNSAIKEWVSDLPFERVDASSNVLSLAEDKLGRLLIGTAKGLILLGDDYKGKIAARFGELQGLSGARISFLSAYGSDVIIGTSVGVALLHADSIFHLPGADSLQVRFLRQETTGVLVGTNKALYQISGEQLKSYKLEKIIDTPVEEAIIGPDKSLYVLNQNEVYRVNRNPISENAMPPSNLLTPLRGNILKSTKIFGLDKLPVQDDQKALAVLTDQGFSFYHNYHYEYFRLPMADGGVAMAEKVAIQDNHFAVLSGKSIYKFEYNKAKVYDNIVTDIATIDTLGITFIADGDNLKYIEHSDSSHEMKNYFQFGSVSHLETDRKNRLLVNEGLQIIRYSFDRNGRYDREELFIAEQTQPGKFETGDVNTILCARDGTVWVAAGPSVFRYEDGKPAQEFNFFLSSNLFPSRTYRIDHVFETLEGKIYAVGSNEAHLYSQGISMAGGLLEWDQGEGRFRRIDLQNNDILNYWFVTSYTPVSKTDAILGTTSGFAMDRKGKIQGCSRLKDPSYDKMLSLYPNLYLGTAGKRFNDRVFLFGCAAGVVAYDNFTQSWYYPQRLNAMLPEDLRYGNVGGRHVNALEVDRYGRIYVATDLGFLIYDNESTDPTALLSTQMDDLSNYSLNGAYQINREASIVLDNLPLGSESYKKVREAQAAKERIESLETMLAQNKRSMFVLGATDKGRINADSTVIILDNERERQKNMLAQLERTEPALYQLLELKPLDLYALSKQLADNEIVIQYLPTNKRLFIQLVAKSRVGLVEVLVDEAELMKLCQETSSILVDLAKYDSDYIDQIEKENNRKLMKNLEKLYEILLRPVENIIQEYPSVYVVPVKQLFYVPFAALINRQSGQKVRYAAEEYNIGYLTSLYLMNLLLKTGADRTGKYLLMGDPNNDLKSARIEVNHINELIKTSDLYVGSNAKLEVLKKTSTGCRVVHLATHGKLNPEKPEESTLEFANREKLNVMDAFDLPLQNTELVILSACETGVGKEGMEFATLSRAFTRAGASNVMASLWQVEDASTSELMYQFYSNYLKGKNKFQSLAEAQRSMIQGQNLLFRHPSKWSAFIDIGRP
jgi:CHAT domain-containing protein/predicted Zn-dependent protease